MYVNIQNENKFVEIWLTRAERDDAAVRASLGGICQQYKTQGRLVVVYLSGDGGLYPQTRDLLLYNKRRLAELGARAAAQETMSE